MHQESIRERLASVLVVAVLLLSSLVVVVAFAPPASAAVVTGQTRDVANTGTPYIRDDSTAVPFWGFGATANAGESLTRVEVWFEISWWTALQTADIKPLTNQGGTSGVALFRDNGLVDDQLDAADTPINVQQCQWIWDWPNTPWWYVRFNLNFGAEPVPAAIAGALQWFIVIRTDPQISQGTTIRTWINAGGILFSNGANQPNFNIAGTTVTTRVSRLIDVSTGAIGAGVGQAALGIAVVDGGPYEYIDYVTVRFQNDGGFDATDIAAVGLNPATSGVALYRDDGANADSWDAGDTGLIPSATAVAWPSVSLDIAAEPIPNAPTGSYEYFIVVRSSATIANGDSFTVYGDEASIRIDGTPNPSDQNVFTPEAGYDDSASFRADLLSPTITSAYWSEVSSYMYVDALGTLWFSDRMTFAQTATFNCLAQDNVGGSGMWYGDFSYEPSLASGGGMDTTVPYTSGYSVDATDSDLSAPATVTVHDRAGNTATSNLRYSKDVTVPTVAVLAPTDFDTLSGLVTVVAQAADGQAGVDTASAMVSWDYGASWRAMTWNGAFFTYPWDTSILADGSYRLLVQVRDNVYNTGSDYVTVRLDNTGPASSVLSHANGQYVHSGLPIDVEATASDASSVSVMQARLDAGAWTLMTFDAAGLVWTAALGAPGPGNHWIRVRATDSEGNVGPEASVLVIGDANDPSVVVVAPAAGANVGGWLTIRLKASDAERLVGAIVYLSDGTTAYTLPATLNPATGFHELAIDTNDLHDGTWSLTAVAVDEAGRMGTAGPQAILVDNSEPTLAIGAPAAGTYIYGTYTVSATATDAGAGFDNGGVVMSVDGGEWSPLALSGGAWTADLDTTAFADGAHTVLVAAIDDAGNYAVRSVTVYFDNTPPKVAAVSPYAGERLAGVYAFAASAQDDMGLRNVSARIAGPSWTIDVALGYDAASGYYEWTANTSLWPDGTYTMKPYATELSGRAHTGAAAVQFFVDNHAPGVTVLSPRDGEVIVSPTYVIAIDATDGPFGLLATQVLYRVDAGNWRQLNAGTSPTWSISWDTTEVQDGPHSITFRAVDASGRVTDRPVRVVVDNHDPDVALVSPSPSEYIGGTYTFSVRAADLLGVWNVGMHFGFSRPSDLQTADATFDPSSGYWELTVDTTTLPDGLASLVLVATDTSGRTTTTDLIPFAVDNRLPGLTVLGPAPGAIVLDGELLIEVNASDEGFTLATGDVEYDIDGTGWLSLAQDIGVLTRFAEVRGTAMMADGEHTLTIRATDGSRHMVQTVVRFVVDNTDPMCSIVSPAAGEYAMGVYHFRVAASDRLGIAAVDLTFTCVTGLRTASSVYNPASGYWEFLIDTTTIPDAAGTITAIATDASGRRSAVAGPVEFTIDNNAPDVAFVAPLDGETITEWSYEVVVRATDPTFPVEEGDVTLSIDGGGLIGLAAAGSGTFAHTWNTTGVADAEHVLHVRATDPAGHVSEAFVRLVVDNHDPTLGVVSPTDGEFVTGTLLFQVAASDSRGIVDVSLDWVGGRGVTATLNAATNYYEYTLDTTTLIDGNYTLAVTAVDGAGRASHVSVTFQVDNHVPSLSLEGPLTGDVLSGTVTVRAVVKDTFIDTLQFSVDGVGWVYMSDGEGTFSSAVFADGPHTVTVRAIDGSGKEVSTTSHVTFDNNPPLLSVVSFPTPGEHVAGDVPFKLFVSDVVAVLSVGVTVGNDSFPVYLNPVTGFYEWALPSAGYPDGALAVTFTATDPAGHNSTLRWEVFADNTAPDVAAVAPAAGESVRDRIVFSVSPTDATGVASVQLRIGAGPWISMSKGEDGSFSYAWETSVDDNDDALEYTVRATDTLGNSRDYSATIRVANPNYAWVAMLLMAVFIVLGLLLIFMRNRKERLGEALEPADGKGAPGSKELAELEEILNPERVKGPDDVEVEVER